MDVTDRNPFLKKPPALEDLDPVACPKCGNGVFGRYFRVLRPKGGDASSPLFTQPLFVCANCSEVINSEKKPEKTVSFAV